MGVEIKGLSELQAKFEKLTPNMEAAAKLGVYKAGLLIEGTAKNTAPVDTGNLKGSINTVQGDGISAIVGTPVEYAMYVELGTSKAKAQPYLRPALRKSKTQAQDLVSETIAEALR